LLERAKKMTVAEGRALLISAGILNADGELAPHYRPKERAVKKVLSAKSRRAKKVSL
jgi:hypothetical protein